MSTIDLKEIKFKELSAAVVALNNSECFKGKEKIATVGVSKIALVEAFLAAVENVPDNEKGEWTGPQVAGNYYNKIVVVEDPGVIVEVIEKDEESENEIKEIVQTEDILLSNEISEPKSLNVLQKIDNPKKNEVPGIIASILEFIKKGPITKNVILEKLVDRFPEKDSRKMNKTISAQIGGKKRPVRMEKEKNIVFIIDENGFSIKQ